MNEGDLNIRALTPRDYDDFLADWWLGWKWEPPRQDFLPDTGFCVYDKDTPICAGFVYITNSKVAWVDWIISNPKYRRKPHRKNAIKLLIEFITESLASGGFGYAYALIKHPALIEVYKENGYFVGDKYQVEMIKSLTWQH